MTKHKVVLLRHGESTWNKEKQVHRMDDVDLPKKGCRRRAKPRRC